MVKSVTQSSQAPKKENYRSLKKQSYIGQFFSFLSPRLGYKNELSHRQVTLNRAQRAVAVMGNFF